MNSENRLFLGNRQVILRFEISAANLVFGLLFGEDLFPKRKENIKAQRSNARNMFTAHVLHNWCAVCIIFPMRSRFFALSTVRSRGFSCG